MVGEGVGLAVGLVGEGVLGAGVGTVGILVGLAVGGGVTVGLVVGLGVEAGVVGVVGGMGAPFRVATGGPVKNSGPPL